MTIFLVLWLCSFRIREVEYSIKSSIGLKNETKKFGERAQLYCTLMWDFFWDHTISLSLLGALECVVRVLMHFCFWNIEGTLVSIDHCGFKVMFLFHVFIRSKHLTVLCQVSVMHFPGIPNNYWCEDLAQLWASLKCVPQNCRALSVLAGLWQSEFTLQFRNHCILSHSQGFNQHLGFSGISTT